MAQNRLKELRMANNLYQKDVAKFLNKTVQAYSYYEAGKRTMDQETLARLSNFFHVSIDYILGHSPSPVDGEHGLEDSAIEEAVNQSTLAHEAYGIFVQLPPEMQKAALTQLKALADLNK